MYGVFQFLMVRLKDILLLNGQFFCNISIPYGAIKRNQAFRSGIVKQIFQFLMVRLKVAYNFKDLYDEKFQFLMVRLKAFLQR